VTSEGEASHGSRGNGRDADVASDGAVRDRSDASL